LRTHIDIETTDDVKHLLIWQGILSEANEVVSILQSWRPEYFDAVDPMCSYIIYLAACILVFNHKGDLNRQATPSTEHVDLASLFLSRVGQYWPIGASLDCPDIYHSRTRFLPILDC
jgi:hypothetical protein